MRCTTRERAAASRSRCWRSTRRPRAAQRRVAWTVVAHTAFERGEFDAAERGYGEVLALTPEKDAARNELVERHAASIYKQGEQARAAGQARDAVAHFARVASRRAAVDGARQRRSTTPRPR